ncbi:MAG: hypothetical protein MZV70_42275 [Desulfobacterales bacterium]|nr:hypothetical protein [Desulfobacterales bacterium]
MHELKIQPEVCHSQFFRTVLAPARHLPLPGLEGVEQAKIGDASGYQGQGES